MKIKITEETYKRLQGKLLQEDGIVDNPSQPIQQPIDEDEEFHQITNRLKQREKESQSTKNNGGFETFDELIGDMRNI
jgi:hypothetical protein